MDHIDELNQRFVDGRHAFSSREHHSTPPAGDAGTVN